jgi:hypothetical protein
MSHVIHDSPADHSPDVRAGGDQLARQQAIRLPAATRSRRPPVVIPTNKITVALPFSKITTVEPARELAELAAIVAELASLVEAAVAEPEATELRMRAQALAARIR